MQYFQLRVSTIMALYIANVIQPGQDVSNVISLEANVIANQILLVEGKVLNKGTQNSWPVLFYGVCGALFIYIFRCERCRTGFYNFPDCRPCDCPTDALCDTNTG